MYFLQSEHNPPHIHAIYGEYAAAIAISNCNILDGYLPAKAYNLVCEWINLYHEELLYMWQEQEFLQLPPLE